MKLDSIAKRTEQVPFAADSAAEISEGIRVIESVQREVGGRETSLPKLGSKRIHRVVPQSRYLRECDTGLKARTREFHSRRGRINFGRGKLVRRALFKRNRNCLRECESRSFLCGRDADKYCDY
jgi:hypothetical protein